MKEFKDYLKTERLPTTWCPGCGNGLVMKETAKALAHLKLKKNNTVMVSGIGCAGRTSGYFNLDTVHTLHGRAIPVAEGIKRGKFIIVLVSGDGDLASIGTNHLIHSSRRDTNMTIICINNEVYGMTGGQLAPTTKKGKKTITSPTGNKHHPINIQGLVKANKRYFYARSTVYHIDHLQQCIIQALNWKGFSFVEIISDCIRNYGRRQGYKNAYEMLMAYKTYYKLSTNNKELKDNEIGIIKSVYKL